MLLDAMTGKPGRCGAPRLQSLATDLREGDSGMNHRNERREGGQRSERSGEDETPDAQNRFATTDPGFRDYHRNPKPQACRESGSVCLQQSQSERKRRRNRGRWKEANGCRVCPAGCPGELTGVGDERGARQMEPRGCWEWAGLVVLCHTGGVRV